MSADDRPADPGVEAKVARPGGVSYLGLPTTDPAESAEFYRAVFGWEVRGEPSSPSFSDGSGHVIGHWRTDRPSAGAAGGRPYVYVNSVDEVLRAAAGRGAQIVTPPYPEGSLTIAAIRDPGGNVIGVWQGSPR